ncbi:MAG TPA: diguanylate cyclase [Erysipelotrichaceae bacterium]|nr:diguanylate cyclase [Erysipelotrichaceae bacterium]
MEQISSVENEIIRINQLNQKAKQVLSRNPEEALEIAQEAFHASLAIDYASGICMSQFQLGIAHWRLGQLFEALDYLHEADQMTKDIEGPLIEVEILNALGNVYLDLQVYDSAYTYYQIGLQLSINKNNEYMKSTILSNIGEIYRELNDYDSAIELYQMSLAGLSELNEHERRIYPLSNISAVYLAQGDLNKAEEYSNLALNLARECEDRIIESVSLKYLGMIARERHQYDLAVKLLNQSLSIYSETKEALLSTEVLFELHEVYRDQNDINQALIYLNEIILYAEQINAHHILAQAYKRLINDHQDLGNTANALFFANKYIETVTKLEQSKVAQRLSGINLQKQAEIAYQERETYYRLSQELDEKAKLIEKNNEDLAKAYQSAKAISKIGRSLTVQTNLEEIYDLVYQNVAVLMESNTFGIGIYDVDRESIEYKYLIVDGERVENYIIPVLNSNSLAVKCFIQNEKFVFNHRNEIEQYLNSTINVRVGQLMESIMFVPLSIEDKCIGLITVQNREPDTFSVQSLETLDTLSAYLAIAIRNAQKSAALNIEIQKREVIQQELKKLNKELSDLSEIDGLTGIANRRHFDEFYEREFRHAIRYSIPLSLMMIDIDNFKEYNDHYGHLNGDKIIIQIAQIIKKYAKRSNDLAVRFGGDEFIVLLSDATETVSKDVATKIQEELIQLNLPHEFSTVCPRISLSIGIATLIPQRETLMMQLIEMADNALYISKDKGRNQISVFKK